MSDQFRPIQVHGELQQAKKLEIGLIGLIFGDAAEKPGNIAAAAIVLSFIMFIVLVYAPDSSAFPKSQAMTLLGSVITGALGFLFGRSSH